MDWIEITEQTDYPEQHIRIHSLQRNSDLQLLMAQLDSSSAAALLLINNRNSYEIDARYFPPGDQVWPVPVMVVTGETGERIRSLLEGCPPTGAEACVEIEPSQDSS